MKAIQSPSKSKKKYSVDHGNIKHNVVSNQETKWINEEKKMAAELMKKEYVYWSNVGMKICLSSKKTYEKPQPHPCKHVEQEEWKH